MGLRDGCKGALATKVAGVWKGAEELRPSKFALEEGLPNDKYKLASSGLLGCALHKK